MVPSSWLSMNMRGSCRDGFPGDWVGIVYTPYSAFSVQTPSPKRDTPLSLFVCVHVYLQEVGMEERRSLDSSDLEEGIGPLGSPCESQLPDP